MSQALRKLAGIIKKSNTAAIFINQLREKVGVMYGNPEVTTGGRALKFYSSVRMDIRRIETLKKGTDMIGNRTRAKIVKNKMAPPFKTAEFDIMYGEGISREGDILDMAVELNIIKKAGSWFSYGEERLGQGRDKVKEYLKENPEFANVVEQKIRDHFAKKDEPEAPEESSETLAKDQAEMAAELSDEDMDEFFELNEFEEE